MRRGFSDIHKFHLHWGNCNSQTDKNLNEHLNVWIFDVLKCNVQDLSICIEQDDGRYDHKMRFSHFLFNSQSQSKLVLDLTNNCESQFMSVGSFFVEDGDSINRLISSCPILESLILKDIWIENGYDVNVKIESHGLKHLEINSNIEILVWSHYNMAKIIKLSTPNLTSFICKDYMSQGDQTKNVSSLITADIDIVKEYKHDALHDSDLEISEKEKQRLYPKRMVQFIKAFRDVKELTISSPGGRLVVQILNLVTKKKKISLGCCYSLLGPMLIQADRSTSKLG
ncbi:hypothetical protein MKW94_019425, partial [Papaver nudicaule]|nr:hypothetical protein [Papaver nudicaule]